MILLACIFLAVVAGALLLYDGTNNDGW